MIQLPCCCNANASYIINTSVPNLDAQTCLSKFNVVENYHPLANWPPPTLSGFVQRNLDGEVISLFLLLTDLNSIQSTISDRLAHFVHGFTYAAIMCLHLGRPSTGRLHWRYLISQRFIYLVSIEIKCAMASVLIMCR